MATRFELVLHGADPIALRAAGEEALAEIERLEDQLSLYRPSSEISHLNAGAAKEAVRVSPSLFALLETAKTLWSETEGAFDITIAPLVKCWGFMGGSGRVPDADELAEARATVGMHQVHLDRASLTVRFEREGVMLDLGAIGKGYAIERASEVLRDAGTTSALLHGGTSTVCAIGHPPEAEYWKVALESAPVPENLVHHVVEHPRPQRPTDKGIDKVLAVASPTVVHLKDEAMSVSAIWGKWFQADGKSFGHVIDPRSGQPVTSAVLAAVVLPSATETDAFSTALLTLGQEGQARIAALRPGMRTVLA
jgi:thiamine biosynthesis lipoprotein